MTRYIIECDDPDDIILGARIIKRLQDDSGVQWAFSEFGDNPCKLWMAHKTKTGFSARYLGTVLAKREQKP